MGTVKIKDMEGNEEDLRNLFQMTGCSLARYLKIDEREKVPITWLWILLFALFTVACCVWNNIFSPGWHKVAILGLFLLSFLLALLVHFNFRNWHLTAIAGIGALTLVLIATNVYPPGEVARRLSNVAEKKMESR